MSADKEKTLNICPHLGLHRDPTTPAAYPSTANLCQKSKRHRTPNPDYQQSICLTRKHLECPLYAVESTKRMPSEIRFHSKKWLGSLLKILFISLVVLFIFVVIFIGANYRLWFPPINNLLLPSWKKTQQVLAENPTLPILTATVEIITPTLTPQPTPTQTSTQIPSSTPTRTLIPSTLTLDTPIGGLIQFVIHRTQAGESLEQFANRYNTTVEAIRAVNYRLPSVLYMNRLLIIPVGVRDASSLPAFSAYEVTMRGLSPVELADQLGVAAQDLSAYNNVPLDYIFTPGEWIIVPRE